MSDFIFYMFAVVMLTSAFLVVSARQPVHAVLFLILTFLNAASLLLMLGAEYIAMTLIIVYVGAVVVLFLFVVMMLNVDFAEKHQGFTKNIHLAIALGALFFIQVALALYDGISLAPSKMMADQITTAIGRQSIPNTSAIGQIIYTQYFFPFQIGGLILLVAMIGAIVLTMRHSTKVRRQDISKQISRHRFEAVEVIKVKTGEGISGL
ncbi:MAG: NADH-quinone oxidoreductase subunit J [Proteobacteria bacterium]|nr:NADH-quinone oxidoreductase subunit J [Pseudomonadota bacterium]